MSEAGVLDLWCRALCSQRLIFPLGDGYRLTSQRPRPSATIAGWVRCAVRLLSFQLLWAAAYFLLSLTARRVLLGVLLNPIYMGAAIVGLYGALTLSYVYVAVAIVSTYCCSVCFLAFIFLNYAGGVRAEDDRAWVVLALYLPAVTVDVIVVSLCVPLLRALLAAERAERSPSGAQAGPATTTAVSVTTTATPAAVDVEEASERGRTCPVCMAAAPDTVLLPCRHVVCAVCAPKLPESRCPICRKKFSSTMKVFLG